MAKVETITIDGYKIEPDINSDTRYVLNNDYPFEGFWDVYAPNGDFIAQVNTLDEAKTIVLNHIQADMMVADLRRQGR